MKDKVQLLREETGCDEEQAKVILESTHNDVSKAIKVVSTLLKHIVAIKGRFKCEKNNVYGLFFLIADIRQRVLIRLGALVTYNPGVYEKDLATNWHDYEKQLYALKLGEGSIQDLTQNLQHCLQTKLTREESKPFYQYLRNLNTRETEQTLLSEIVMVTGDQNVVLNTALEQLTLAQFKELRKDPEDKIGDTPSDQRKSHDSTIILKTELVMDPYKGTPAVNVKKGDLVSAKIVDMRDIGRYLAKLLGGEQDDEAFPLVVPVDNVELKDRDVVIKTRFSPGIVGKAVMAQGDRVEISKDIHPITVFLRRHMITGLIIIVLTILAIWFIYK
ncbi:MAG: hypothetical protein ABH868_04790 [bacterium]